MRIRIGNSALYFLIAAFALGCSSQGDRSAGGAGRLEETILAPSDTLTQEEQNLMASAEDAPTKVLADMPSETP